MAVASNEVVCVPTPERYVLAEASMVDELLLHEQDGRRLSMSEGTKGPRFFDWAVLPLVHQGVVDGCHWLLIRRWIDDPREKASYLVFAPAETTLQEMVRAIGARWHIEEDLEATKDLGLDHYEVRSWIRWYRHVRLVLLAYAFLVGICVQDTSHLPVADTQEQAESSLPLLPLTTSEVRHLLARLIWPVPCHATLVRTWSWWRRLQQYWASSSHTTRRLKSG